MTFRPGPYAARLAIALMIIAATMITSAGPAAAHNALRSTTPTSGQRLAAAPDAVVLEFDEPAIALGTQLLVTGPGGEVQDGAPELVDTQVRQRLRTGLGDGVYTVAWRVTSADGHPVSGTFDFVVGTGTAPPSVAPAAPAGSGVPWLGVVAVTIGLASIAVAAIALGTGRRRRRSA